MSLDTTLEYSPEDYNRHKLMRDMMRKRTPPRIPVLLFAQARRNPRFTAFDTYLLHSPHYEAEAAPLDHDDFLTHGFLGRALSNKAGAEAVRDAYQDVCRTIRSFLDASLKGDSASAGNLLQAKPASPVTIRFRPAN